MQKTSSHKNKFALRVRHRLLDLDLNVTELASRIGRPRPTVSKAIHGGRFPRVRQAIARELRISLS